MRSDPHPRAAGIDPEAAGARYAEAGGSSLPPGAALVVYRLGAGSCDITVIRSEGGRHVVAAAGGTDAVGGLEFDELLLAYLSGRHRDADPEFWRRVDRPADLTDVELRAASLHEIKRVREYLSSESHARLTLPHTEIELLLTREELQERIAEPVERTVELLTTVLDDAEAAPADVAGVLLTGGASRTPLISAVLRERLGVEPMRLDSPAAGGDPRPVSSAPAGDSNPGDRRVLRRIGLIAAASILAVVVATVLSTRLGNLYPPDTEAVRAEETPTGTDRAESPTPSDPATDEPETGSGGDGAVRGAPSPVVTENRDSEPEAPTPGDDAEPTPENGTAATMPEVTGLSTAEAREALAEAGFSNVAMEGEPRGLFDWTHSDCEVIEQEPAAGARGAPDDHVLITFVYTGGDTDECES
ncbi:Hsp70 family protein [Glycomyces halotolerans]